MIWRKGIDLLLLAFDRLVREGFEVRLQLVGREAELATYLQMVGPETRSRIDYEGFQAPELLPKYFWRSDAFVLPSRHDGWGVVVNQALAAGLPIITSDAVGAGLDLVEEGVNGACVHANDEHALFKAMKMLVINPEVAREWGAQSQRKARDLTPEAGAQKWVHVFERVLSSERETRR
jgi:glycosyltransferase involved in cell wall biosynthesis